MDLPWRNFSKVQSLEKSHREVLLYLDVHESRAAQSRQSCVNSDWLSQWQYAIFDPHGIDVP